MYLIVNGLILIKSSLISKIVNLP